MNSYDSYGRKTGSYVTNGSTTRSYDSYGRNTGTIKETSSGYNTYDNYGRKTSTVKKRLQMATQNTMNTEEEPKPIVHNQMVQQIFTIITVVKQVVIKKIQTV